MAFAILSGHSQHILLEFPTQPGPTPSSFILKKYLSFSLSFFDLLKILIVPLISALYIQGDTFVVYILIEKGEQNQGAAQWAGQRHVRGIRSHQWEGGKRSNRVHIVLACLQLKRHFFSLVWILKHLSGWPLPQNYSFSFFPLIVKSWLNSWKRFLSQSNCYFSLSISPLATSFHLNISLISKVYNRFYRGYGFIAKPIVGMF